jgi:hypothetical protein
MSPAKPGSWVCKASMLIKSETTFN